MKKKVLVFLSIVFFPLLSALGAVEKKVNAEEVLVKYPSAQFKFDFDGDGKSDICVVSCKKVKDFSADPRDKEKKIWYQFQIKITSSEGKRLFENWHSSSEDDYQEIFQRWVGGDIPKPGDYVRHFFKIKTRNNSGTLNSFGTGEIAEREIDKEGIAEKIRSKKAKTTVEEVVREITKGQRMILYYYGDWAESILIFVYSRELGDSVRLLNEYEMPH